MDDFEKRIMPEVVPAGELGVRGFDDIGALEGVKTTLQEVSNTCNPRFQD